MLGWTEQFPYVEQAAQALFLIFLHLFLKSETLLKPCNISAKYSYNTGKRSLVPFTIRK